MTNCTPKNRLQDLVPGNWSEFDSLLNQVLAPTVARTVRGVRAPLSVWEADDAYHVELDVPGVSKDDIELTFEKDTLQIVAERKQPESERKGLHEERVYGKVTRSLSLSESVDPDSITAELNNGVLHVTVAKVPEVQPKRIDINYSRFDKARIVREAVQIARPLFVGVMLAMLVGLAGKVTADCSVAFAVVATVIV